MNLLKPKDIAKKLNTPPEKISNFARDIENAQIHVFERTPLGSLLFREKDIEILKEYNDLMYFFRYKNQALEMLNHEIDNLVERKEEKPEWMKMLYNSKFLP